MIGVFLVLSVFWQPAFKVRDMDAFILRLESLNKYRSDPTKIISIHNLSLGGVGHPPDIQLEQYDRSAIVVVITELRDYFMFKPGRLQEVHTLWPNLQNWRPLDYGITPSLNEIRHQFDFLVTEYLKHGPPIGMRVGTYIDYALALFHQIDPALLLRSHNLFGDYYQNSAYIGDGTTTVVRLSTVRELVQVLSGEPLSSVRLFCNTSYNSRGRFVRAPLAPFEQPNMFYREFYRALGAPLTATVGHPPLAPFGQPNMAPLTATVGHPVMPLLRAPLAPFGQPNMFYRALGAPLTATVGYPVMPLLRAPLAPFGKPNMFYRALGATLTATVGHPPPQLCILKELKYHFNSNCRGIYRNRINYGCNNYNHFPDHVDHDEVLVFSIKDLIDVSRS